MSFSRPDDLVELLIFNVPLGEFFSISTWLLAIGGSIIVLLVYSALTKRRKA